MTFSKKNSAPYLLGGHNLPSLPLNEVESNTTFLTKL